MSGVVKEFLEFVRDAELVIHNAEFDLGFLDAELARLEHEVSSMRSVCGVLDTLMLARHMHPGQRVSLDALCKRYEVDNSGRDLHGALLDAQLLAEVYLAMTGGQAELVLGAEASPGQVSTTEAGAVRRKGLKLVVQRASEEEIAAHEAALDRLEKASGGKCLWRQLDA